MIGGDPTFAGWRVIATPTRLLVVKACGAAATQIEIEGLIRAAQACSEDGHGVALTRREEHVRAQGSALVQENLVV